MTANDLKLDTGAADAIIGYLAATDRGVEELADALRMDAEPIATVLELLSEKRQVIFYGPPGTGKTFTALRIAEHVAGNTERVCLVQFHPSYAYEDFVQGYRPTDGQGEAQFILRDGPLLRIAADAQDDPDNVYVLVIDEINRGNIARVFGEMYFLLEYRGREIELQYATEDSPPFVMPSNLKIIGTMNSSDRSIALIDGALRRRFYFYPFFPLESPVRGVLRRWLNDNKPEMEWVADIVEQANHVLVQANRQDAAVGPSYFMRDSLDDRWLGLIWRYSVMPYLEEQLLGDDDLLGQLRLEALMAKRINPGLAVIEDLAEEPEGVEPEAEGE